jgi:hypothetical protein
VAAREEMVARAVTADRMVLGGSDKNSDEQRSQEASRILADDDPSLAAARPNTRESKGEENLLESLHRDLSEHLLKREEDELRRKHANAQAHEARSLKELEQRELDAGMRSSLFDAWGRTLFQHTAVSWQSQQQSAAAAIGVSGETRQDDTSAALPNLGIDVAARCSWCEEMTTHTVLVNPSLLPRPPPQEDKWPLSRKPEYTCNACRRSTCPCDNHPNCLGMSKRLPFWDDALCRECDERDRAEAQHVLNALSHVVDEWGEKTSQIVGHVKEHSEQLADRSHFKGIVGKFNKDFSRFSEHGKGFIENVDASRQREVEDGEKERELAARYFGQMLGHLGNESHKVFVDMTKGIEDHSEKFVTEVEGHSGVATLDPKPRKTTSHRQTIKHASRKRISHAPST